MNEQSKKKRNTAIFVLVATILNIVLMLLFMIIGYILLAKFGNPDNPGAAQVWLIIIFVGSIGLSWFIYSRIVKWYTKKVDVDKKFAPLIGPSNKKPRKGGDGSSGVKG